jgi:phage shock protein PspC (stress-responsive transcriptional regulator)
MIGGVAGGIAEYFDIDPVIARAAFIVLFFAWGTSLLAYLILWIIVPDERKLWERNNAGDFDQSAKNDVPDEVYESRRSKKKNFMAYLLIIIGSALLIHKFIIWIDLEFVIPVLLIAGGAYMLYKSAFKPNRTEA